jgi:hypothetical protein
VQGRPEESLVEHGGDRDILSPYALWPGGQGSEGAGEVG